ncbi:MAG: CoA pyrophosphatase [Catenulispora sp.]|nr:CoA pyrophosphatase [Catenulispora sp.]
MSVAGDMGLQIADSVPDLPDWLLPLARAVESGQGLGPRFQRPEGLDGVPRRSAVLILFGEDPVRGPDLLFVERAKTLRNHPGQPAFPGGKVDPGEGPVATALREANEETDLDPAGVEVFGILPDQYVWPSDFLVTPVLGWWRTPSPVRVRDLREVASVARIAVSDLADPANRVRMAHPSGRSGPAFAAGPLLIWGFTAALLDGVLRAGGWEQPWDTERVVPLPQEVLALAVRNLAAPGGEDS